LLTGTIDDALNSAAMGRFREMVPSTCRGWRALRALPGGCRAMIAELRLQADPLMA